MKKQLAFALLASTCLLAASSYAAEPAVSDGIGGVVTSSKGPEAGVWVIAETKDLPTRFIKIVVTDDQGRFMLPELPKAKYKLWVRGYGLVDSKKIDAAPGKNVDLTATLAPNAKAAAEYYPANYWFALMHPPAASEFPGTGPQGNGIAPLIKTQQDWLAQTREGCLMCHQLGEKATRDLANNSAEGWAARIAQARGRGDPVVGNVGPNYAAQMQNNLARYGRDRALKMFADWTQRIAQGEIPAEAPPRPAGIERNVVLTIRDWGNGHYMHDEIASDRRNPTVNANGPVYAVAASTGYLEVFNPTTNTLGEVPIPGNGKAHDEDAFMHNPMMDHQGRIWMTDAGRGRVAESGDTKGGDPLLGNRADYCVNGASDGFAKYYPMPGANNSQIDVYDPATKKVTVLPSCFHVHHLNFGRDKNNTLFFSGDANVVGWLDTKVYDDSHDLKKAEGWCPMVLDTKERGVTKVALGGASDDVKITPDHTQWNEPGQPVDTKKDTRISGFLYGMDTNPKDGSIWYAKTSPALPTGLVRFERGSHPPETCKTEYYQPPKLADGTYAAFDGRSVSFDSNGIAWVAYGSGHFASFDRSKCKVLNGPTATGQHCPEGWKLFDIPGPKLAGTNITADWHYLDWVDQYNTLGLGKDVPLAPGSNSDSLIALMPDTGKVLHFRVPYPMGFYSRGMDGRIDNPKTGWKGRGIYATYSDTPAWHQEGGDEGAGPELVHFQIRPDPLAH